MEQKKIYILYFCDDHDEPQYRKNIGCFTTEAKALKAFSQLYRELNSKRVPSHIKNYFISKREYKFDIDYNIKLEITNLNDILEYQY